ncbi:MAG TPA: DUF2721 domain-containing protein [Deltaproteobacteria bacterium]|nr:DUF2721 domain-containing protein [Deltaproteobacteria bacterium]HQB39740.1 DUF2721 domain-containing protein [Deltaproteobacteria bacterium]
MNELRDISVISHVIQSATAPVFLLTAIGTFLTVTTNRLGRITDRNRYLERQRVAEAQKDSPEYIEKIHAELANLAWRTRIMDTAITLFTFSALLVCVVIAIMFSGNMLHFGISSTVSIVFIAAMILLIAGLISFLIEIYIATKAIYYPY